MQIALLVLLGASTGEAADAVFSPTPASFVGVVGGAMAWGDYDNDGYLDVILTGNAVGSAVTVLYRNNGDGTFQPTDFTFSPYRSSSVDWGDFNNDGYLDLLVTGLEGGYTRLYQNRGGTNFIDFMRLPAVYDGRLSWGDFNNDGWLDFAITGAGPYSQVYQNLGGTNFAVLETGLRQLYYGSVGWADYDRDGRLDLLLTGLSTSGGDGAYVYRNDGAGHLGQAWFLGSAYEPGRWIDFDNDGWPDLALQNWAYQATYLYRNSRLGGFDLAHSLPIGPMAVADFNNDGWTDLLINNRLAQNDGTTNWTMLSTSLPDLGTSTLVNNAFCGDYDNDGRLDLILSDSSYRTSLYRNLTTATNRPPRPPTHLESDASPTNATLRWVGSTDEDQTSGLTYNLRVGTTPGGVDVVSPMAAPSGFRRVVRAGNAGTSTEHVLSRLTPGTTYYWSVQAVDNSFAGSPFASEQSFVAAAPAVSYLVGSVSRNLDRQTGLFFQEIVVINTGPNILRGLRVSVTNLPAGVHLVSATSTNPVSGAPFAELTNSLASGQALTLTLAYYSTTRETPLGTRVFVEPVSPSPSRQSAGEAVAIRRAFFRPDNYVAVEFDSRSGRQYAIQYSTDLSLWAQAQPVVPGSGGRMIWIDTGPPATDSLPSTNRFYRLVLLPE